MENLDLEYICTYISNLAGIPVRLFHDGDLVFYHSTVNLPKDPMVLYREEIFNVTSTVGYFVTPHFNYYGIVNAGADKLVLGPTRQLIHNTQDLRALAFRMDIPKEQISAFLEGMQNIVRMPLESVMQMLCVVNYILNGEKRSLKDIAIFDTEQQYLRRMLLSQSDTPSAAPAGEDIQHPAAGHSPMDSEQTLMNIIRRGDTTTLKQWIATAPVVRPGVVAADQLRQSKNIFITSATLVSRAAIHGGMDSEDALSMSDAFIQKCELLNDISRITNLQYRMVVEYTEQVERIRHSAGNSHLAIQVTNYIHHHLSEHITAEDIAKHLYLSRPYLSAKFKEETNISLTDFILNEKTEEAKRLLCYTEKSLINISSYLGFSSQSHFSRVFRRYSGYSPKEYRRNTPNKGY